MLSGSQHDLNDSLYKSVRNFFMKKVAHRVDEDHTGAFPFNGNVEVLRHKNNIEAMFERMSFDASPAFSKGVSITVFTTITYFITSSDRVPCGIRPLYFAVVAHKILFALSFFPLVQRVHVHARYLPSIHRLDVSKLRVERV